ncbi:hypothetical protein O0881_27500 [Janthinobacterium sp. SUN100]|uniref:hypothetical protein n=1 Tax=Janthinobacterium sp. SUN100 TaxID=3004101 RepID=UPI0025B0141D|nr:hypothetical protein [Janthinobacterium sp. SUN100]MDN2705747.1 hypothetical protein [Janthinobacterium sp. SUN100]
MSGSPSPSSISKRTQALLLSGLVFPGSGHFLLKRKARGCLFLVPALIALVLVLRQIMARLDQVMAQIDSGALPLDVQLIVEKVDALSAHDGPAMTVAVCVLVACWIGSLVDTMLLKP